MFLKFDMKNWKNNIDAAIRYACQLAKGEQTNITAEINGTAQASAGDSGRGRPVFR